MYNELKTAESLLLAGSRRPIDPETQGTAHRCLTHKTGL